MLLQEARDCCNRARCNLFLLSCFDFVRQEPGSNEEIKRTTSEKYGVKFDMFAKIDVNGSNADPLWNYLKMKKGGTLGE